MDVYWSVPPAEPPCWDCHGPCISIFLAADELGNKLWDAEMSVGSLQYFELEMFSSLMRVAAMTLLRHRLTCSWLQSIYWLKYQKILHQQRRTKVQAWKKCQVSWGSQGGKKWWKHGCVWIMLLLTFIYKDVIMGKKFFLIWTIFKVCIEFVAILFLLYIFLLFFFCLFVWFFLALRYVRF